MKLNRYAAVAVAAVFVSLGVIVPAGPASAAGVPTAALPACSGDVGPTGGWLVRDMVSTGTNETNPAPVRPRNARLGEPCFDTEGFVDPVLAVPVTLSDVPVDGVGEDGVDATELCATNDPTNCGHFTGFGYVTATPTDRRVCMFFVGDNSPAQQITLRVGGTGPGGGATNGGYTVSGAKTTYTGGTVTCPGGSNAVLPYSCGVTACVDQTTAPWEWRYGSVSSANSDWTGNMIPFGSGVDLFAGTQAAHYVFGAGSMFGISDPGEAVCSTDYGATSTTTIDLEGHGLGNPGTRDEPPVLDEDGNPTAWTIWDHFWPADELSGGVYESNCAYLVSIRLWVCAFTGHSVTEYGCLEFRWSADRFRVRTPYPEGEPTDVICDLFPDSPGCFDIVNPPYIDGTDFDVVCAGAPEPTWAVWDWLFPWVGHMLGCLFIPVNGPDRLGWVAAAWEGSAGGSIGEVFTAVGNSFAITGGCGNIMDADVMGVDFQMDTCSWTWAALGKQALYWLIVITGCLAAVFFIFRSVLAIVNTRMPVPFDEDKN